MESYYAHGKLLITGEYVVLDGAKALAAPTQLGQYLTIDEIPPKNVVVWNSLDQNNNVWFSADLNVVTLEINETSDVQIAQTLCDILQRIRKENPAFLAQSAQITTKLEFDKNYGLGTSSTLISLLSQASHVPAFELNSNTFKSSGYDIACAVAEQPLVYTINSNEQTVTNTRLPQVFKDHVYFIFLGQKKNSRAAIADYRSNSISQQAIQQISDITDHLIHAKTYKELELLINQHERIISELIKTTPVKEIRFNDYWGEIKSLGAWGGDFVLAMSDRGYDKTKAYFNSKGYQTFYRYDQIILDE